MEIPTLVRERLGGESIEATVTLGDEDIIAVTPTRTILYRGEGLLSDESVEVYSHDVEQLDLSVGRRNTKFSLTYVDGTKEFKVPGDRADTLLQILMQSILRVADVADEEESVAGVFQFSELTLVVTESRLVKHIGTPVWDNDFEVFDYADVTALDFEEGSVATQIVLTVSGRPQRIKAPSDQAPQVEQTLTQTLCTYYDVSSLDELAAKLSENEEDTDEQSESVEPNQSTELELDDGISPLVGNAEDADRSDGDSQPGGQPTASTANAESSPLDPSGGTQATESGQSSTEETPQTASADPQQQTPGRSSTATSADHQSTSQSAGQSVAPGPADTDERVDPEDIDAIKDQLSTLTEAVKRQNQLLREHNERLEANDEKVDQLIEELRRGR